MNIPAKAWNEMKGKMEDTSLPEWQKYYIDLERHKERYAELKPQRIDFPTDESYQIAYDKWSFDMSMSEPNRPGYIRANND